MQQDYPEFVTKLGNSALETLPSNPTPVEIADEILALIEDYHSIIADNRKEVIIESDHFEYTEVSDTIISNIMLEMIISVVARDVTEYVCENVTPKVDPDEVVDEFSDRYIQVRTSHTE